MIKTGDNYIYEQESNSHTSEFIITEQQINTRVSAVVNGATKVQEKFGITPKAKYNLVPT